MPDQKNKTIALVLFGAYFVLRSGQTNGAAFTPYACEQIISSQQCNDTGGIVFMDTCLMKFDTSVTWYTAYADCLNRKKRLLELPDNTYHTAYTTLAESLYGSTNDYRWMGGRPINSSAGNWTWYHGNIEETMSWKPTTIFPATVEAYPKCIYAAWKLGRGVQWKEHDCMFTRQMTYYCLTLLSDVYTPVTNSGCDITSSTTATTTPQSTISTATSISSQSTSSTASLVTTTGQPSSSSSLTTSIQASSTSTSATSSSTTYQPSTAKSTPTTISSAKTSATTDGTQITGPSSIETSTLCLPTTMTSTTVQSSTTAQTTTPLPTTESSTSSSTTTVVPTVIPSTVSSTSAGISTTPDLTTSSTSTLLTSTSEPTAQMTPSTTEPTTTPQLMLAPSTVSTSTLTPTPTPDPTTMLTTVTSTFVPTSTSSSTLFTISTAFESTSSTSAMESTLTTSTSKSTITSPTTTPEASSETTSAATTSNVPETSISTTTEDITTSTTPVTSAVTSTALLTSPATSTEDISSTSTSTAQSTTTEATTTESTVASTSMTSSTSTPITSSISSTISTASTDSTAMTTPAISSAGTSEEASSSTSTADTTLETTPDLTSISTPTIVAATTPTTFMTPSTTVTTTTLSQSSTETEKQTSSSQTSVATSTTETSTSSATSMPTSMPTSISTSASTPTTKVSQQPKTTADTPDNAVAISQTTAPVKATLGPETKSTKQTTTATTTNIEDLFGYDNTTLVDTNIIKQITARLATSDKLAQSSQMQAMLPYFLAQLPPDQRASAGITLSSMLLRCNFDGKSCLDSSNFRLDTVALYGTCYTFNYNIIGTKTVSRAGRQTGLFLLLDAKSDETTCVSESAGLRISLQNQGEAPFPMTNGLYIRPGLLTSIIITRTVTTKISGCTSTINKTNYFYDGNYTVEGCLRTCQQKSAYSKCGCADPGYPKPANWTECVVDDISCLEGTLKCDINPFDGCDCKEPCVQVDYGFSLTTSGLSPAAIDLSGGCSNLVNETCADHIKRTIAEVEIFYEHLVEKRFDEALAYPLIQLYNDICNSLGIYLGIAMFFVAELLGYLFQVFAACAWQTSQYTSQSA